MATWDHLDNPEQLVALVTSPTNIEIAQTIETLVVDVRAAMDRSGLRKPQEDLVDAIGAVETRYHDARKRVRRGGNQTDRLEQLFWRRAAVQLRAVGDAIAWHFLDFRRQWILLLGRNQHPGLMTDKPGFGDELASFQRHWDAGEASLLTGLTNCITSSDLLVAEGNVLTAFEIKRGGRFRADQTARLEQIVKQINTEPRVDGPTGPSWILESQVPMSTYWRHAGPVVARAKSEGVATWVPAPGVGVIFFAWARALELGREFEALVSAGQASARNLIGGDSDRIVIRSQDYPYRSNRVAPMTIYPISSEQASFLLTGQVSFTVELRVDALADALRAVGFSVESALPDNEGKLPPDIFRIRRGSGRGTVHRQIVEQLGIELMDLGAWATSLVETFAERRAPGRWAMYSCLANEADAWS
jgi:hypothetical protein